MADAKELLNERLHNYLRTYVKGTKLTDPQYRLIEATNEGDNYVGIVYRVIIEGKEYGKAKNAEIILKTIKLEEMHKVISSERMIQLFERELSFYREVLPIFKETLKGRGATIERFPILYDAVPEKQILMLENLTSQGFVMASSKILDYPHLSLALRGLGEFHASSFITRVENPRSFDKFKQMKDFLFTTGSIFRNGKLYDIITEILEEKGEHYSKRFRQFLDNIMQNMIDATDGKLAEPYAVVCHGDAWTNNILFKYDQKKTPCELRFLDLQLSRYASPIIDLVYILFCCCTQETRSKYYDRLVHEYYETLSECLKRSGHDPNILFPYEALSEQFIKFGKYAAGMAILVLHLFATNKGIETVNTDPDILRNESFFISMVKGTFQDLIDKNYI